MPGGQVMILGEATYPEALLDLPDPPPVLFAAGDRAVLAEPLVAVVGTRRCTRYGDRVARELGEAAARSGAGVVSGMAIGIDAAAHRGALAAGGRTIAVLGTGPDVAYPAAHAALHREILAAGLVLSEHPPGARANAGSFPRRNRIIAALAAVTVVVEAGLKSGALITAGHALDLGRTVAAVPGPIDVPQSAGSNELLRDGAVVIAAAADLLALAGTTAPAAAPRRTLTPDEQTVWELLARGAADLDALAARSLLPAHRCLAAVSTLELDGAIECAMTGEIRRR
jgi:DNA processing protein